LVSDQDGRDAAGEERPDRSDRQRRTGAALFRHLETVEGGHHRPGLTGNVDQDRRGRAAILRTIIDAGQHDQRTHRRQAKRDRKQHGHGGDGADARQHAHERANQRADQTQQNVDGDRNRRATEKGRRPLHELENDTEAEPKI
jgi:hypothetical protein